MRFVQRTLVLGILAVLFTAHRAAAVEFAAAKSYPVGANPSAVVVADFNGDGKPDLAVLNVGSNDVSILLSNGDGTLQAAKTFPTATTAPSLLFAGDFNGDGKQDLMVFQAGDGSSVTGVISILLGNSDGTLQAAKVTPLTVSAVSTVLGDFNNDKKLDLILANTEQINGVTTVTSQLLAGKGDGTFQTAKSIANLPDRVLAVADLNKDGNLDLIVKDGGAADVFLGKGDGTFQAGGTTFSGGSLGISAIFAADFNGDGKLDLVVGSIDEIVVPCIGLFKHPPCHADVPRVAVFLGHGDGTFGTETSIPLSNSGDFVQATGDFNGDGKTDLIGILVRLGKGDGTFSTPTSQIATPPTAVLDLNGDKLDDLVALDPNNNAILVSLNTSPASGADLAIVSASPDGAKVGQGKNLTYAADILNEGPTDATNVTFTDTLPNSVSFVSATSSAGTCTQSHLVVTCTVPALPDASDVQISIVVTATATGTISNTMTVAATETDLAPANNSATQTDTVLPFYTLTVSKSGSGTGTVRSLTLDGATPISCGTTCSASLLSGTTVDLIESPDAGSFFTTWGGACSGNAACQITMNGDQSVTANFVKGDILSVTLAGSGAGEVEDQDAAIFICTSTNGDCSPSLAPGSTISIKAVPSGNSIFGSWSGACTGSDPNVCSITLTADQTVTATFNPPPDFTLTPAAASLTVKAGSNVSEVLSFSSQGGFNAAIALTCSVVGVAPSPTCNISPNSVTPGSRATLTVDASGVSAFPFPGLRFRIPDLMPNVYPICMLLAVLAVLITTARSSQRRRLCLLAAALLLLSVFPAACGSSNSAPPPPVTKSFTVTVTATSGAIQHATIISVSVN